jgi:hypothetical protein
MRVTIQLRGVEPDDTQRFLHVTYDYTYQDGPTIGQVSTGSLSIAYLPNGNLPTMPSVRSAVRAAVRETITALRDQRRQDARRAAELARYSFTVDEEVPD